jgi:oligopeptide transport system substrate-binding protein
MLRTLRFLLVFAIALMPLSAFSAEEASPPKDFIAVFSPKKFSLDPLHTFTAFESQFYTAIYEGLVVNNPFTLEPIPGMAERWDLSDGGRIYRFTIRQNAVYSDGTPLRAQDFVDSWMRMIDPASKAEYSFLFDPIKGARAYRTGVEKDPKKVGIRAVGDRTLEVELEKPAAYFLKVLAHISFLPIYPAYLKNKSWGDAKTAIGNGPYIITQRNNAELLLEKNKLYWDADHVALDRIRIRFTDDDAKATTDFLAGKIDWSTVFQADRLKDTKDVVVFPMFATLYLYFVSDQAPWNDPRVRRGLSLLLPWDQIRSTKQYIFPDSHLIPSIPSYPEVKSIDSTQTDEGLKLLAEAGFPGGKGLPTFVIKVADTGSQDLVKQLADAWKSAIGLSVDVRAVPQDEYLSQLKVPDFTMGISTWIGDYADPLSFLQLWTSDSNLNDARYSDTAYDKAVMDSISIQDPAARYKKLAQAEEMLLNDAVILPLAHSPAVHLIDLDRVDGWFPNPLDIHPFKFIGFKEHKAPSGVAMLR